MKIPNSGFVIQFGVIDHTIGMRRLTTREHNCISLKFFTIDRQSKICLLLQFWMNDVMICIISNSQRFLTMICISAFSLPFLQICNDVRCFTHSPFDLNRNIANLHVSHIRI